RRSACAGVRPAFFAALSRAAVLVSPQTRYSCLVAAFRRSNASFAATLWWSYAILIDSPRFGADSHRLGSDMTVSSSLLCVRHSERLGRMSRQKGVGVGKPWCSSAQTFGEA